MRIVTGIGQTGGHQNAYQAGPAGQEQQAAGAQERLKDLLARQSAGAGASAGGAGGKPKASLPDDQVGQLAAELANARSRFDVQQVAGKAMRALASLRMTAALCEGRDKAKINRMIARMEKLMKRTRETDWFCIDRILLHLGARDTYPGGVVLYIRFVPNSVSDCLYIGQ